MLAKNGFQKRTQDHFEARKTVFFFFKKKNFLYIDNNTCKKKTDFEKKIDFC